MDRSDTILIASDHNGNEARDYLVKCLMGRGYNVVDLGPRTDIITLSEKKVDYVDYAVQVGYAISKNPNLKGILICGTGVGMSIAANRFPRVRASLVTDSHTAQLTREHNDSNVLVMGSWNVSREEMEDIVWAWLEGDYGKGRHEKRVAKLSEPSSDVVLVPGVFDLIHLGHTTVFDYAKTLGRVVVALNTDRSAERVKGSRPINNEEARKYILQKLTNVDEVILMDDDTPANLIEQTNAKYLVKGAGNTEEGTRQQDRVPEHVQIKIVPIDHAYVSSKIREKIRGIG
jgi:ribose 5-phosphate isomerase B